jgi:ABC-2 type transport system ATP-binding protein
MCYNAAGFEQGALIMPLAIETQGLTKCYGDLVALKELDLRVEVGSVFGFVGPNGAGKTTTMRILATLLRPTAGEAWIAGHSVRLEPHYVRRLIGYMPDTFGMYGEMLTWEYLDFFAACYGIRASKRQGLAHSLLELVGLSHRRDDGVATLSRGMRQRLCLARVLVHDPAVLILDEPASGLDPRARVEIRELLKELRRLDKTVLISSHVLSEIEDVCTHVGIIEGGALAASGSLADVRHSVESRRLVRVSLMARVDAAQDWLRERPEVVEVIWLDGQDDAIRGGGSLHVVVSGDDATLAGLLAGLVSEGLAVTSYHEETGDLEDIFLRLTHGAVT